MRHFLVDSSKIKVFTYSMGIRTKNKRGGQKGNQNARKHGFYSSTRSPDEMCRLQDIIAQESIDPEIAVFTCQITVFGSVLP